MQNQNERDGLGYLSDDERAEGERDTVSPEVQKTRSGRGFAGMSPELRRSIASKGGQAQGKANNPGNFANNREKAVAAGAKGGRNSHGGGRMSDDTSIE